MKRIVSLVLVVALLMTSTATVLAKGKPDNRGKHFQNEFKAAALYDMGLFKGRSPQVYDPDLGTGATRAEAIKMIGEALGWPADTDPATGFKASLTKVEGYTDVPAWAAPYIDYAIRHNVTNGIGNGKFGANLPVNARMVYTWYARALYYTEDIWNNTELLVKLGFLTADQYAELDRLSPSTRDALTGIMFDSLRWKMKGSDKKLIQRLVQLMWVSREKAENSGLFDPEVDKMTWSLKPLAANTLQGTFSQTLNGTTVSTTAFQVVVKNDANKNGTFEDAEVRTLANGSTSGVPAVFGVGVSGKAVLFSFMTSFVNGDQVFITPATTIKAIATSAVSDGTTKSVLFNDTTVPALVNVEVVNASQIKFIFSEPVGMTADQAGALVRLYQVLPVPVEKPAGATFAFSDYNKVLTVNLATPLANGRWEALVTAGLRDEFGNVATAPLTDAFTLGSDNLKPGVTRVDVMDHDTIQITFSEAVVPAAGDLRIRQGVLTVDYAMSAVTFHSDNKVALLQLNGAQHLTEASSGSSMTLFYKDIRDYAGNVQTDEKSLVFTVPTIDLTAPTATVGDVTPVSGETGFTLTVQFSEPVDGFALEDLTLTKERPDAAGTYDAVTVAAIDVSYVVSDRKGIIKLDAGDLHDGVNKLRLTLKGTITDVSLDRNPLAEVTRELAYIHLKDVTAPDASAGIAWDAEALKITVVFSEPVDGFALTDYMLKKDDAEIVSTVTAGAVANSHVITVTDADALVKDDVLSLTLKDSITDTSYNRNKLVKAPISLIVPEKPA